MKHSTTENEVHIHTDRLEIVRKISSMKIKTNIDVEICKQIEKRWSRGFHTRIIWVSRNNSVQRIADREAERAATHVATTIRAMVWFHKSKADRRNERNNRIIEQWQNQWDNNNKGRPLYRFCGSVGFDLVRVTFKAVQLLTGHGNLRAYLNRFGLAGANGECECGMGQEDQQHVLEVCTLPERRQASNRVIHRYGDLNLELRRENMVDTEQTEKIVLWAEEVMKTEDFGQVDDEVEDPD